MRLYPARYPAADEILDVHREMRADLSWPARVRADADLFAHALRVRLGLDSASAGGRFFELATPFALGVTAAYGGILLMRWYAGIVISPGSTWSHVATTDLREGLHLLFLALLCGGGIVALLKYWRLGVAVSIVGLLAFAADWLVAPGLYDTPLQAVAAVLTALVVVACPPDRRPERKQAAAAGVMAAVAWFPSALILTRGFVVSTDYGAWPLLVLAATGLALSARPPNLDGLAAVAAASPLFLAHAAISL